MVKLIRSRKGITLTELMITVAIMGILLSLSSAIFFGGIKFFRQTQSIGETQRDARRVFDLINRELRQAQASTLIITRFNSSNPPCSMVQFTKKTGDAVCFYQSGSKFYIKNTTDNTLNQMADNLRAVIFTYPDTTDDKLVSVSICFEKATYEGGAKALQLSAQKILIMND